MVWWCPSGSPSVRPTLRPSGLRPPIFRTFLLHALTYWAEILHMTLFWCTTDQVRLSSLSVVKFYGQLRLIRSVLRTSKFSVLKLIEIVTLWVYYTIPFGFTLFRHFRANIFYFWNHYVLRRITDEGSLPVMRIWSIMLIKSELKWCIHLSRSIFLYLHQFVKELCLFVNFE